MKIGSLHKNSTWDNTYFTIHMFKIAVMNENKIPKKCWIIDQLDEDDLEDLWIDYYSRPKHVYQSLTRDG
jgi:hypothetical protein